MASEENESTLCLGFPIIRLPKPPKNSRMAFGFICLFLFKEGYRLSIKDNFKVLKGFLKGDTWVVYLLSWSCFITRIEGRFNYGLYLIGFTFKG